MLVHAFGVDKSTKDNCHKKKAAPKVLVQLLYFKLPPIKSPL
jgi:hypothetical protein